MNSYVDPHDGLRSSVVNIDEFFSIMRFCAMYYSRTDGVISTITGVMNFTLSFLLGFTKLARGDSVRRFFVKDFRADYNFGPDSKAMNNFCDVTQEYVTHKKRNKLPLFKYYNTTW